LDHLQIVDIAGCVGVHAAVAYSNKGRTKVI